MVDLRNNPGALQGLLTRVRLQRVGADALARSGLLVNAIGFALVACLVFVPRIEYPSRACAYARSPSCGEVPMPPAGCEVVRVDVVVRLRRKTINSAPAD